ncbi:MAG: hypothetical protein HGA45_17605, partial [Chloroflexales bacterium]|nr:hypothetical protein [Chloroflexales bacterium]
MSLAQLLSRLCSALPDLAAEEVADALYLAAHLPATTPARALTAPAREPIGPGASEPPTKRPAGAAPPAATEPDHRQPEQGRADGTASLYAWRPAGDGAPGLDFRTPQAPPLPGRIELGRALRPLLARAPSAHARALDVAATVRQIADTGLWLPVMRPVAEPRFGVALVLDDTPSMAIWRSALVEFTRLLERHTALRELRCYRLSFDASGQGLLAPGLDRGSGAVPRGAVGELADPSGRTLVLLASDAVGCHWSDGRMARTLAAWARHTLVALVQMLPETLWERS